MEKSPLTSLQNPLVKHLVKVRTDSAYRKKNKTVVLDGLKPIQEQSCRIFKLFYTSEYENDALTLPGEKFLVSQSVLEKISGMTSPEGIVAEITQPSFVDLNHSKKVLALDGITDPGNMGTLLRTALALGWEAVYFLPGCCDPFNEKVLRAARGAHFQLILSTGTAKQLKEWVQIHKIPQFVADLNGTSPEKINSTSSCLLVLGNEAHGASNEVRQFCQPLTIPMPGQMESLNVAVAGGILLYLLSQKKSSL